MSLNPWRAMVLAALAGFTLAHAQQLSQMGNGHPRGPSPEALQACQHKQADQASDFSTPNGITSGNCWAPSGKPLACKPAMHAGEPKLPSQTQPQQ